MAYCDKSNGFCSLIDIRRKQSEQIIQLAAKLAFYKDMAAKSYTACGNYQGQIKALEAKKGKCKWTYDENYDMWETDCGGAFCLESGTPADNKMKYCSYCGKMIWQ